MNARHIACLLGLGLGGCMSCAEPVDPAKDGKHAAVDEPEPDDSGVTEPKRCADDRTWVQVSAGEIRTCGRHGDGCIECWGGAYLNGDLNLPDTGERLDWVDYGDGDPPNGVYTRIAVAQSGGGASHACALDVEGRVSCWGRDDYGQSTPPTGTFMALSLNSYHSCGIRTDFGVACWGRWEPGVGVPTDVGFVSVQTGESGSVCAIHESGYVACWNGDERYPDRVGAFSAVGVTYRACASGADQPLDCWKFADGEAFWPSGAPLDSGYVDVCLTGYPGLDGCALAADGHVSCWEHLMSPETLFSQISCGSQHVCGVTLDGEIECWGNCNDGECDVPS